MPLNIPMPMDFGEALLKGVDTGSNFFTRLMQPIIEREKQAQLERHFQEELKLKKAAAGRAAANSDIGQQFAQFNKLAEMFGGTGNTKEPVPSVPIQQSLYGEGQGVFPGNAVENGSVDLNTNPLVNNPEAGGQNYGMGSNTPTNPLMEKMKKNPILRAFFKHKFGIDPLAVAPQTPEEKQAAQLDLFKKKEEFKSQQEQKMPAAIKTLHENIIHLSPKAITALQHLIDIPSPLEPWGLGIIKSGQKAAHSKAVTAAAENYSKAKGWPNTKGSIEKAESILQRGNFETDFDYRKRLREYQDELKEGIKSSSDFLHPGKQIEEPKDNIIEYVRVNGKLVPKGGL